ncbi:MAG TPA: RHS repeat-associated core domain-containing protein [Bryobacteraceae bacterium]|nr:RHS repeat-associated core domain-containing protein [Bryobacteraceae bacterium]
MISGGGRPWSQTYNYDAFGNRWIEQTQSTGLPALTYENASGSERVFQLDASNRVCRVHPNEINPWCYDANGNVLQEGTVARSFTYDAENRQVTACLNCTPGSPTGTYAYDGLGQRVSKTANGQTTTYVYDAFGNLAAEYGGSPSSTCTGTCYVTTDHLGSTRLLTDSSGNPVKRFDYLPFGEEIFAGVDNRTTGMGYDPSPSPDSSDPKYTGQYRDAETVSNVGNALDFFNARYFSGAPGRFQSPDPGNAGADPSNPQSWNMYSYVNNNPLSYTDPSGMMTEAGGDSGGDGGGGRA